MYVLFKNNNNNNNNSLFHKKFLYKYNLAVLQLAGMLFQAGQCYKYKYKYEKNNLILK